MKHSLFLLGILTMVFIVAACPVQAFTAKNLDITVQENGDSVINFDYDLTWYENIVVLARIADPGAELKKALISQFNKPVEITGMSGNHLQLSVKEFASRQDKNGIVTIVTPGLSFKEAQKVLDQYWFAKFISPDFSPAVTRIHFPDGAVEEFDNLDTIPQVRHVISSSGV